MNNFFKCFGINILLNIVSCSSLQAHVQLSTPLGGERYQPGQMMNITWTETVPHEFENWDLYISYDNQVTWQVIQEDMAYEVNEFQFEVPNIQSTTVFVRVVQDNVGYDYEDISGAITIADEMVDPDPDPDPDDVLSYDHDPDAIELRIFPNPVGSSLGIKGLNRLDISGITLLSLDGRLIDCGNYLPFDKNHNQLEIDVSALSPGPYLLQIVVNGWDHITRICKM